MLLKDDLSAAAKHPQQQKHHIGEKPQHSREKSALSWAEKRRKLVIFKEHWEKQKGALDIDRQGAR